MTPPVYREKIIACQKRFDELYEVLPQVKEFCPPELWVSLNTAIANCKLDCVADIPISRGGIPKGFGVNKAKKAIACDNIIAIVKQIKALKAW
jgi:hypothetical protein